MARITWTKRRLYHLRRLMDEGLTYRQIGQRLGTTRDSVRGAAREYGFMRPELCTRGPDWSREEYDTLERLMQQGLTYREIGEQLGKTRNACRHAAHRLGLSEPGRQKMRLRYDWPRLVPMIRDLAEVQAMALPQMHQRLEARGEEVGLHAIRYHLRTHEPELYQVIVQNAHSRRARMNALRGMRTRKRQHQEAA